VKAVQVQLPVFIFREGEQFVAFTPALDLSTSAPSQEEAKENFDDAVKVFFEETERLGTTDRVLSELGWQQVEHRWTPPVLVSQEHSKVAVPVG
jgi:hypothetical protein